MSNTTRIGRNDPCWCNSGQKYKYCHLDRETEIRLPQSALAHNVAKKSRLLECLHPSASPSNCTQIISAHTIQSSTTLQAIADDTHHVLSFHPPQTDSSGRRRLNKVGINNASTFEGFCSKHDNETFAPIEKKEIELSPQQCFLLLYRTTCHEYYQKKSILKSAEYMKRHIDKGLPIHHQYYAQKTLNTWRAGVKEGFREVALEKAKLDEALLSDNFSGWNHLAFYCEGAPFYSTAGSPTPNFDFSSNKIQNLEDPKSSIQPLHFSALTILGRQVVFFSWRIEHTAIDRFMDSLETLSGTRLPTVLVQLAFHFVENTYFSSSWWNSLSTDSQNHIESIATNGNPYADPIPHFPDVPTPLTFLSRERLVT